MVSDDTVAGTPPPARGGTDPGITIPSIRITLADGNAFKANLPAQVGLVVDPDKLQGADGAGHPRLYMPDPVRGGSSGSHYDTALAPNALMEPAINDSLDASLNLVHSANQLQATSWTHNDGKARIGNCDTGRE